jgi:hypothetical protein
MLITPNCRRVRRRDVIRKMLCEDLDLLQQDRWQFIYRSHKAEGRARLLAALRQKKKKK